MMVPFTIGEKVLRLQPVEPLALVRVRSNPPMNEPKLMFDPFSMSPMFRSPMAA